jgi:hypothetical protein
MPDGIARSDAVIQDEATYGDGVAADTAPTSSSAGRNHVHIAVNTKMIDPDEDIGDSKL